MKKILLIGGAGFIGSNLVHNLLKGEPLDIYVIEPEKANIGRLNDIGSRVTIIRADLKDVPRINDIICANKIGIVIHLVSTLLPNSSLEDYQKEMNDILLPSLNIMRICSKKNILFVYLSSGGTVYGNGLSTAYKESAVLDPISYYGLSKVFMEQAIVFENRHSGLRYLILRPSNPYGKGQNIFGKQGLIAVSIGKILKHEAITIWGDGSLIRDYIDIDNLCEYISELIAEGITNEIINIGSGKGHSVKNIVDIIQDIVRVPIEIKYTESRDTDVNSVVLCTEKLNNFIPSKKNKDIRDSISIFYKAEYEKYHK